VLELQLAIGCVDLRRRRVFERDVDDYDVRDAPRHVREAALAAELARRAS